MYVYIYIYIYTYIVCVYVCVGFIHIYGAGFRSGFRVLCTFLGLGFTVSGLMLMAMLYVPSLNPNPKP